MLHKRAGAEDLFEVTSRRRRARVARMALTDFLDGCCEKEVLRGQAKVSEQGDKYVGDRLTGTRQGKVG